MVFEILLGNSELGRSSVVTVEAVPTDTMKERETLVVKENPTTYNFCLLCLQQ